MSAIDIVGISGSLRRASYNTALLRASQKLAPEGMKIRILEIGDLPLYNMDLESDFPAAATAFKDKIRMADGVLFATPEHNFSFPGILKNAIDWASRPYGDSAWDGKPAIVQSASTSWTGGLRAQYHLFQVMGYFEMKHMRFPEVCVGSCKDKFDADLNLTDPLSVQNITKQLAKFAEFIRA